MINKFTCTIKEESQVRRHLGDRFLVARSHGMMTCDEESARIMFRDFIDKFFHVQVQDEDFTCEYAGVWGFVEQPDGTQCFTEMTGT